MTATWESMDELTEHRSLAQRVNAYAVILDDDGRILLSRWAERRAWTITGGQVGPGENPEAAAKRFTFEESGFIVEIGRLEAVDSRVYPPNKNRSHAQQAISLIYRARVIGGEYTLPNTTITETDQAEWFPLTRLPVNRIKQVDSVLRSLGLI